MKKLICRCMGIIFMLICSLLILQFVYVMITPTIIYTDFSLLYVLFLIAVTLMIGTVFIHISIEDYIIKKKFRKIIMEILFGVYLVALLSVLFGNMTFSRMPNDTVNDINLRPFKTIFEYIKAFSQHSINRDIIISNLFGNFIMFMPMGLFLPCFYDKFRRVCFFSGVMFVSIIGIEVLQLLSTRGSCDIDDVILNFSGAIVFYLISRKIIAKIQKRIEKQENLYFIK